MREILFRGKRADNGEWVYGDLLHNGYDYDVAIWETEHKLVTEVIPETVGQYTGLTANGTKIFEGDIVKLFLFYDTEVGVVGWSDIYFRFKIAFSDGLSDGFDVTDKFEVIGNIHDNPELLGGAE